MKNLLNPYPSDDILQPALQLLIAALSPSRIFLFPYYPPTVHQRERSIDLIIVLKSNGMSFEKAENMIEIIGKGNTLVNAVILNEGQVIEGLREGKLFYCLCCSTANLIYQQTDIIYPEPGFDILNNVKQEALTEFLSDHDKATTFYTHAVNDFQNANPLTPFFLHQSVELSMRGVIKALMGRYEKTHEIRILRKQLRKCARELKFIFSEENAEETMLLKVLDESYAKSRYDQHTLPPEILEKLKARAKFFLDQSKKSLRIRLQVPVPVEVHHLPQQK